MSLEPKPTSPLILPDPGRQASPVIECASLPFVEIRGIRHLVQDANTAFCQLVGQSRDDLIGNPFSEMVSVNAECLSILDRFYQAGEPVFHARERDEASHSSQWLYARWSPTNADESPVGVIIQSAKRSDSREITEVNEALLISGLHQHERAADAAKLNQQLEGEIKDRKATEAAQQTTNRRLADQTNELERLVAERTEKLRETVADLEGFSYSVAHDMRTPLRGMQGFARILLDDHAHQLDADGRSHLERIISSAARMDMLIQDVLNYTRVMRGEALMRSVDLDKLVRDMIATYPNWQAPKVMIEIEGSLPLVVGHEGFLTQCVSNLLSNAIKFVAPGVTPHVKIRAEDRRGFATKPPWLDEGHKEVDGSTSEAAVVRVWFEDNGISIATQDRSRVFRMFERITPAEQTEGTGMGLTIVRKAIQRLGGRIDFESQPGKGSKFWIELRKSAEPPASTSEPK